LGAQVPGRLQRNDPSELICASWIRHGLLRRFTMLIAMKPLIAAKIGETFIMQLEAY
jgi:hypothetical protein